MGRKRASGNCAYEKREKTGRGTGSTDQYDPWLDVSDFTSSTGMRSCSFSDKLGRVVHTLSNAEYMQFLMLDWDPSVIEIYEQYPLNTKETTRIAKELGFKEPGYTKSDGEVLTSDFFVKLKTRKGTSHKAYQVKSSTSDIHTKRAQEILAIESEYWKRRNIPWELVFSESFNTTYCDNLHRLSQFRNRHYSQEDMFELFEIAMDICKAYPDAAICNLTNHDCELQSGIIVGIQEAFLILIAKQLIKFDIENIEVDSCLFSEFKGVLCSAKTML